MGIRLTLTFKHYNRTFLLLLHKSDLGYFIGLNGEVFSGDIARKLKDIFFEIGNLLQILAGIPVMNCVKF